MDKKDEHTKEPIPLCAFLFQPIHTGTDPVCKHSASTSTSESSKSITMKTAINDSHCALFYEKTCGNIW